MAGKWVQPSRHHNRRKIEKKPKGNQKGTKGDCSKPKSESGIGIKDLAQLRQVTRAVTRKCSNQTIRAGLIRFDLGVRGTRRQKTEKKGRGGAIRLPVGQAARQSPPRTYLQVQQKKEIIIQASISLIVQRAVFCLVQNSGKIVKTRSNLLNWNASQAII